MESEISTDSEPGFFIVHHKIKWSVTWRLIWHAQKQDLIEPFFSTFFLGGPYI